MMITRWEVSVVWFTEDGDSMRTYAVVGKDPLDALSKVFEKHPTGTGLRASPMATKVAITKLWQEIEEIE